MPTRQEEIARAGDGLWTGEIVPWEEGEPREMMQTSFS